MVLKPKSYSLKPKAGGQVALSLVFLIGGIMLVVGATIAFVIVSFLNSSLGFQAANEASVAAASGVNDALLQLVRNRNFSDTLGYCVPDLSCGGGTTKVTVLQNSPGPGQAVITSAAGSGLRERKLRVVVAVSPAGEVRVISFELLTS